jgi:hypothetical protein
MLYEMANASASPQNMINKIFKIMIDHGIIAYINNIPIYSQINEKY